MKWISIKNRFPDEGVLVLTTNYEFLDPSNERYYVVALFLDGIWIEPETREALFKPDYWHEINPPLQEPPQ